MVAEGLLGFTPPGVAVEVLLHLATLLAVVLVYRTSLTRLVVGLFRRQHEAQAQVIFLVVASVPAAVIGIMFRDTIEQVFRSYIVVGLSFLVTALMLWSTRAIPPKPPKTITVGTALLIGLAQALAIVPGISRSGSTIAAALWRGVPARRAAEFSFILAIVVIAGSGLLEAKHLGELPLSPGLILAFLGALVSGVFAIRTLVWLLQARRFHHFAPYLAILGGGTLLWFGVGA